MDTRIKTDDIKLAEGTDAFIVKGKKRKTLAYARRDSFFYARPGLKEHLIEGSSKDVNPTIELGKYRSQEDRDHEGELIVPVEDARILLKALLEKLKHENKANDTSNCALINDNTDELTAAVRGWNASGAKDLKIPYVNFRHYISLYIRKEGEETKVLILDTQPKRRIDNVIEAVRSAIPEADVKRSTTPLQLDFFSCLVFTLRAIKYFIRHGDHLFADIAKVPEVQNTELNCMDINLCGAGFLSLLKMAQSRKTIEWLLREIPHETASKHGTSVKDCLDKYVIVREGKQYNALSFDRRYRDYNTLFREIQKQTDANEPLDTKCCAIL